MGYCRSKTQDPLEAELAVVEIAFKLAKMKNQLNMVMPRRLTIRKSRLLLALVPFTQLFEIHFKLLIRFVLPGLVEPIM